VTDSATRVVPAGWYDDPASPERVRWWNGISWTEHVTAKPERPTVVAAATQQAAAVDTGPNATVSNLADYARRENGAATTAAEQRTDFDALLTGAGEVAAGTASADTASADTVAADAEAALRAEQIAESRRLEERFGVGTTGIPVIDESALDASYRGTRVDPWQAEEPQQRPRRQSTSTPGATLLVATPVVALIIAAIGSYIYYYIEPNPPLLFAPLIAWLLGILFALADERTLKRRGFRAASGLWAVGTPLVYLIARRVRVPGNGPLIGFLLIAALQPAVGFAAVALGPGAGVSTALEVQQQLRSELVSQGLATSVTCPMVLESTEPGTLYTCDVITPDGLKAIVWVGLGDDPGTFNYAFQVN